MISLAKNRYVRPRSLSEFYLNYLIKSTSDNIAGNVAAEIDKRQIVMYNIGVGNGKQRQKAVTIADIGSGIFCISPYALTEQICGIGAACLSADP